MLDIIMKSNLVTEAKHFRNNMVSYGLIYPTCQVLKRKLIIFQLARTLLKIFKTKSSLSSIIVLQRLGLLKAVTLDMRDQNTYSGA